ncbi:MAG TPA: hydrogenase nickel incorporation protein HypB [Casimicrobiaceae bacterium]|nr:hydrogenase nickel incorporation protein HypB [Casimicrobiaceae bacterium]
MCTTCGCGQSETRIEGEAHEHEHRYAQGAVHGDARAHDVEYHYHREAGHEHFHRHADGSVHSHSHAHEHDHSHEHDRDLDYGHGPAATHVPGMSQARIVQIEQDILAKNDAHAVRNRRLLRERGIFAINLVSSPGSGKTTLLVRSIEALRDHFPICVIEGDQQTSLDADRIRATGALALQVNTGKGCHLDASMVGRALQRLDPKEGTALMIENVGNLVCPAGFDLGEAHKVVVLSVTEGEDKPLKYPDMFRAASLMLLNKIDLLPHLRFDVQLCIDYARRVNPDIAILSVSATTGQGMEAWFAWVREGALHAQQAKGETIDTLKRHIVDLEAQIAHLRG